MYEMELNQPFTLDTSISETKAHLYSKLLDDTRNEINRPIEALEVMSVLMAYFKIAIKRYVDMISMTIVHAFIDEFARKVEERLMEIIYGDEELDLGELVQEDHEISFRREELQTREKHLREVLSSLRRFGIN